MLVEHGGEFIPSSAADRSLPSVHVGGTQGPPLTLRGGRGPRSAFRGRLALVLDDDPVPIQAGAAGCCATVRGGNAGQWRPCPGPPLYAAVWTVPSRPAVRWRVFLCAVHREVVAGARELTAADREALRLRRDRHAAALRGERWIRPRPLSG